MNIKIKIIIIFIAFFTFQFLVFAPKPALACSAGCSGCAPSGYPGDACGSGSAWCTDGTENEYGSCNGWSESCCSYGGAASAGNNVGGYLRNAATNQLLNGREIDWVDKLGNIRKRWTGPPSFPDGGYWFADWLSISGTKRTEEYGSYPLAPWVSNTYQYEAFSGAQNPHTMTAVRPSGWYGYMLPVNFDVVASPPDPVLVDLWYKPPPTAHFITGNNISTLVNTQLNFNTYIQDDGSGIRGAQIFVAKTNGGTNVTSWGPTTSTPCSGGVDGSGRWCLLAQSPAYNPAVNPLNFPASWIPTVTGTYVVAVNAYNPNPSGMCSGNPVDTGFARCDASGNDIVTVTVSYPGYVACPTACGSAASNQPDGAGGTHYCAAVTPPAYVACPTACGSAASNQPDGACGTHYCAAPAACPTPPPPTIVIPTPTTPPTPTTTPVPTFCITNSYLGSGFGISWTNPAGFPVTFVDISSNSSFSSYYNKAVSGTSTTGPNGFCRAPYTGTCDSTKNPLSILPNVTYYVRLYNGVASNGGHGPSTSFGPIPSCPRAPFLKTSGGDVHLNQ
ncbi:MAG: hypothetical protein PHQ59_00215 [Candidatus Daviesbacteria bacterium]|nr:hypothetical protein [Candidatus Daviesbacteria bacterium]